MKFLILLLLFPFCSLASPHLPDLGLKCGTQISKMMAPLGVNPEWKNLITTNPTIKRYIAPTETFGKWVYIEQDTTTKETIFASQTQFELLSIQLDEKCEKKINYKIIDPPDTELTDEDLEHLITSNQDVYVFIWSPEMPLSVKTLPQVKKLAEKENILLKVYLYPLASTAAASITARGENFPPEYLKKLNSFHLSMLGVEAHQPALFRFKKGKLYGAPLFGYKTFEEYEQYFVSMGSK